MDEAMVAGASAGAAARPLPGWLAVVLVTGTSAAVLVLEILAGRVLAPYVGVDLDTYTAIIGTILAGIAVGARAGGAIADRVDPRRVIPFFLVVGGALAIASIPVVRALGGTAGPTGRGAPSVLLALFGFLPSAAVLSAVPPAVVKLQLVDLDRTGTTVGRLSAWGTAGALAGTFLAGFVLVAYAAVSTLIVTTGAILVASGVALWLAGIRPPSGMAVWSAAGLLALSVGAYTLTDEPCDVQSSYYCIAIVHDAERPSGRTLVLDDLRHSYVDLDDPTHLEFWYVRRIAEVIDALARTGPIEVVAIGGGALTLPRWVRATRPGSDQTVLEIDPALLDVVEARLGYEPGDDIEIVTGDARLTLRELPTDSTDVVVGDAFGSRSVPWHLATREFISEIERVLRPGGVYVANIIDGPPESFLRAEAATISEVMPHVAVLRGPSVLEGFIGNSVVIGSGEPLGRLDSLPGLSDDGGAVVEDVASYLDGALVLTDDFAPVDQLIVGAR